MKIASFNINGIKARIQLLKEWLKSENPDIIGLQELKSDDSNLNKDMFADLGYSFAYNGQKSYNGCGILSKYEIKNISYFFNGIKKDPQKRWISAEINGIVICNLYLPNGNPLGTKKFEYKIHWMTLLYNYLKELQSIGKPVVIMGDFNIIPQDIDCKSPKKWIKDALYNIDARSIFFKILNLGFYDALRLKTSNGNIFTQWDYQAGAWQKNEGVRIDHFLLNPLATDKLISFGIDKYMRTLDRPSDHVPIWITMSS